MSARWQNGLDPASALLVVVDVQHGFVNERSRPALPGVVRLLQGWSSARAPYLLSRFHNPPGSPYETITGWTKLRTLAERELAPEVRPFASRAAAVIEKDQSSLFTVEGLAAVRASGRKDLVFCGIDTDACVYDSATDAYALGFRPWIVADACASTGGQEYHEAALLLASRNLGKSQIVTVPEVLARLDGSKEVSV